MYEKMFKLTAHQGNINGYHNELSSYLSWNVYYQKGNAGEDAEKGELLCTVYSHYGKQYGDSFENYK
jgi:hypothetical protein